MAVGMPALSDKTATVICSPFEDHHRPIFLTASRPGFSLITSLSACGIPYGLFLRHTHPRSFAGRQGSLLLTYIFSTKRKPVLCVLVFSTVKKGWRSKESLPPSPHGKKRILISLLTNFRKNRERVFCLFSRWLAHRGKISNPCLWFNMRGGSLSCAPGRPATTLQLVSLLWVVMCRHFIWILSR